MDPTKLQYIIEIVRSRDGEVAAAVVDFKRLGEAAAEANASVQTLVTNLNQSALAVSSMTVPRSLLDALAANKEAAGRVDLARGINAQSKPVASTLPSNQSTKSAADSERAATVQRELEQVAQMLELAKARNAVADPDRTPISRWKLAEQELTAYANKVDELEKRGLLTPAQGKEAFSKPKHRVELQQVEAMREAVDAEQANKAKVEGPLEAEQTRIKAQFDKTRELIKDRYDFEIAEAERACGETTTLEAQKELALKRVTAAMQQQQFLSSALGQELQKIGQQAVTQFGSGLSKAFGQVIQGTKDAKTAFTEFAAGFLQQIAQMIMQALILAAIKSALKGTTVGAFLGFAEGGFAPRLAAAGALNGVQTVSTATYFPAFNTIAGEAGTEVLAVLSRPRLMDLGGLTGYVGQVQGHDLAMTDARQLQSAIGNRPSAMSPGGRIEIAITMSPDVEARVLRNSVEQAVVEINTALAIDSPTSAAVKSLTA